jgi:hypothetical protein
MIIIRDGLGRRTLRTFVLASAAYAASVGFGIKTTEALPRYDGLWSVSIVTEKGDCDRGYRYPIRITNGTLANGGAAGFNIAGNVTPTGYIKVMVSRGNASASGVGRLAGDEGIGSWTGGSCSGTWTAERRGS